jgi:hypothetical protein
MLFINFYEKRYKYIVHKYIHISVTGQGALSPNPGGHQINLEHTTCLEHVQIYLLQSNTLKAAFWTGEKVQGKRQSHTFSSCVEASCHNGST